MYVATMAKTLLIFYLPCKTQWELGVVAKPVIAVPGKLSKQNLSPMKIMDDDDANNTARYWNACLTCMRTY